MSFASKLATILGADRDTTYADSLTDPSVKQHQQDHDTLAEVHNGLGAALAAKADLVSGHVPVAQLGTGTAASGKYLDGTGVWTTLPASGSISTGSGAQGSVALDSFTGADDEALLTAAMTYAAAQTYPPTITFSNRRHQFTSARTLYDGFRIRGPHGFSLSEKNAGSNGAIYNASRVEITISAGGTWLNTASTDKQAVSISQLSFYGASGTTWMTTAGSSVLRYSNMRDLTFANFKGIFGNSTEKVVMLGCQLDGWWEMNNSFQTALHLGGSDNSLWMGGGLLDSSTSYNSAGSSNGKYQIWCDSLEKSMFGPLYITAEGGWNGIRVTGLAYNTASTAGGNIGGPLWFYGLRLEGRDADHPCNGSLFRIEGGIASLDKCWVSYAMASPSTPGHSPVDAGVIHAAGGQLDVTNVTYDRATTVAETVPFVYAAGGAQVDVSRIRIGTKGGAWTGRPNVTSTGTGTVLTQDSSVT